MATLLLTAVGTAVGGPLGGAIGALAGQAIDSAVIGTGTRYGRRLSQLAVQTSSYGTAIPRMFGMMRVAGTVIWATDLKETSNRQSNGKGQPATVTYSYSCSFAVALSSGPIADVGRIWADGNLLRGAAGDWKSATTFRLYAGHGDQQPDPLILSAEGAGAVPAHRGIAYAVFENLALADYGNRIPSLTFELIERRTLVPVGDMAAACGIGIIASTDNAPWPAVTGFALDGADARAALDTMAGPLPIDVRPDAAGPALLLREATAPVTTVTPARSTGNRADTLPTLSREQLTNVPARLRLRHYDPAMDYQAAIQEVARVGAGRQLKTIDWPAVLVAGDAAAIARDVLNQATLARDTASITIPLAPPLALGDHIGWPGAMDSYRITAIEHQRATRLIACERATGINAVAAGAATNSGLRTPDLVVGPTVLTAVELPPLDAYGLAGKAVALAAAGAGAAWRGAQLWQVSGDARLPVGNAIVPAVTGSVAQPLAPVAGLVFDWISRPVVQLAGNANLSPADSTMLDAGANLALIGGELIQFADVQPLGNGQWQLDGLARGLAGTGDLTEGHGAGESFVLLDVNALTMIDGAGLPRAGAVIFEAMGLADAQPAMAALTLTGRTYRPPAPVHGLATVGADGSLMLGWVRRSRADHGWQDGVDEPLGEDNESYTVVLLGADGANLLTLSAGSPVMTIAAATLTALPVWPAMASVVQVGRDALSLPLIISIKPRT